MSWIPKSGDIIETFAGDETGDKTSKYAVILQEKTTTEGSPDILNNLDNTSIAVTSSNSDWLTIQSPSLTLVSDAGINNLYKINFSIGSLNDSDSDRIGNINISYTSDNTVNTTLIIKQLKQIKIYLGSENISGNFWRIKINEGTVTALNTTDYDSPWKVIYKSGPIYSGSANSIDVYIQPKYSDTTSKDKKLYISDSIGNNLNYTIAHISGNDNDFDYTTSNYELLFYLCLNYDTNDLNKDYLFQCTKDNYPTINLHIVNNLITFIYKITFYVKQRIFGNDLTYDDIHRYIDEKYQGIDYPKIKFKINNQESEIDLNQNYTEDYEELLSFDILNESSSLFTYNFYWDPDIFKTDNNFLNSERMLRYYIGISINDNNDIIYSFETNYPSYNMDDGHIKFISTVDVSDSTMFVSCIFQNGMFLIGGWGQSIDGDTYGYLRFSDFEGYSTFINNNHDIISMLEFVYEN